MSALRHNQKLVRPAVAFARVPGESEPKGGFGDRLTSSLSTSAGFEETVALLLGLSADTS